MNNKYKHDLKKLTKDIKECRNFLQQGKRMENNDDVILNIDNFLSNIKSMDNYIDNLEKQVSNLRSFQEEAKTIYLFLENMTQNKDTESNIKIFLKVVKKLVKADNISVFSLKNEVDLHIRACRGIDEKFITDKIYNFVEEGIIDWVFAEKKASIMPDMEYEDIFYLLIPLVAIKIPVGIACVKLKDNKPNSFTMDILGIFANQLAVSIEDEMYFNQMNNQIENLHNLFEINKLLTSTLESEKIKKIFVKKAMELSGFKKGALFSIKDNRIYLDYKNRFSKDLESISGKDYSDTLLGQTILNKTHLIIYNIDEDIRYQRYKDLRTEKVESIIAVPLFFRNEEKIMILLLGSTKEAEFLDNDIIQMLLTLANQVTIALENADLYRTTKDLTIIDDLTKLYNARYLEDFITKEVKRSQRYHLQFSILFMDLDNFKIINDQYGGHLMGSETLKEFGYLLRTVIRQTDIAARYGGDEFVVVAPETTLNNSIILAERIQTATNNFKFLQKFGLNIKITVSIGISNYPMHGSDYKTLIKKADTAMYNTKDEGKNSISVAEL